MQGGTTPLHIGKRRGHIVYFKLEKPSKIIDFLGHCPKKGQVGSEEKIQCLKFYSVKSLENAQM